jgi:microcin C transport system permease protein
MFKISPEFRTKWKKFRRNRRAYASLLILAVLCLFCLPAELIINDRPLALRFDGRWYFPALQEYSWKDFGAESDMPVDNYKGVAWRDFSENRQADWRALAKRLYGELGPELPADNTGKAPGAKLHDVRYVWPLISRHSYKSSVEIPAVERSRHALVPPNDFQSAVMAPRYCYENDLYIREDKTLYIKEQGGKVDGHWLGTDNRGKDLFARLVYSFRLSIIFGIGLTIVGYLVGSFLGAVQGFFGGWVDLIGQRLIEIWGSIPQLFVLMILSSFLANRAELSPMKQGFLLFGILSLTSWMSMDSYMRAEFLRARNLEYVKAARALGQSDFRIMVKHILPNALTPIITFLPFSVSANMLALTSLDFLGLGLKYPAPSLGELLSQGEQHLEAWWILLPTFAVISVSLLLLNFVGEGLRHAFDPRAKE